MLAAMNNCFGVLMHGLKLASSTSLLYLMFITRIILTV